MATYIFETMSAADAANFTANDRLNFQSQLVYVQADIDEALGRITFSGVAMGENGLNFRKSLTFDISDFAANPITSTAPSPQHHLYYGSVGDDVIRLTDDGFVNSVNSLGGNDLIEGSDAGELLHGGAGRDTIRGNGGNDLISTFGALGDLLEGGAGDDELTGHLGNDTLDGGAGNDILSGREGDDLLIGGAGNDIFSDIAISGVPGSDQWIGGPGDDVYGLTNRGTTIVENPGEGIDSLASNVVSDLTDYPNIENLSYYGEARTLTGNAQSNIIFGDLTTPYLINGGEGNDTISGVGTFNGGGGNDSLHGGSVMNGGDGNDVFTSFNFSSTTINGGDGIDSIRIDNSENFTRSQVQAVEFIEIRPDAYSDVEITFTFDQLASLAGTTTFAGSSRNDALIAIAGAAGSYQLPSLTLNSWNVQLPDFLSSSALAVRRLLGDAVFLSGSQAVDYVLRATPVHSEVQALSGNSGNDQLIGGNGIDILIGNAGNDTVSGDLGDDRMSGGAGNDLINGGGGVDVLYGDAGNDSMDGGADGDQLYGAEGNDTLLGNAGDDLIEGNAGDDNFDGGDGNDTVNAGADNDRIAGGAGADRLNGDDGHDDLFGGDGADTLSGGNGNDHLYGQSANGGPDDADNLSGGEGIDYLQGNAGNDTLDGGGGADRVNGGANDDRIFGGAGNDTVNGNLGNDTIDGNADNDSLRGGQGNDSISGSNGNDVLSGDLGSDTLSGGAGNDLFIFTGQNSLAASPDRISDYAAGADRLALGFSPAALLTGSAQSTLSDATSAAQQLFDGRAGNREVAVLAVGSDSYIFYSSTGGGSVDSAILLVGVNPSAIGAGDFG